MVNILEQFSPKAKSNVYCYGEVLSVGYSGLIGIRTTTGLTLSIKDTSQTYIIGDQLVLGKNNNNLNNIFVIRKINRISQSKINLVIGDGQG